MKIGVTGGTGFIGSRVVQRARDHGHEVVVFSRREGHSSRQGVSLRSISRDHLPDLSGLDAVVNLAGESIFGWWTEAKKQRIRQSRVQGTLRLVEAMKAAPPRVFISGSAIGYYGDTGERLATEFSPAGEGFLAEVASAWEAAACEAEALGVRVVRIRTGFVLGHGGAMNLIGPLFRCGLGGRLGSGRQWMSGVHVDDVAGLILKTAEDGNCRGPFNAVMPEPFRNEEFTRELARTLHRPAFLPAPALALRLALGELSHLMLDSSRVTPEAAQNAGYPFRFPRLPEALAAVTGGE